MIFDSKNRVLALDTTLFSVYAVANEIKNKNETAARLQKILNLDINFLLKRLSRDKEFVWIKRKVTDQEAEAIKNENIDGVFLMKETKRSYPNDNLFCHVLGFADMDNNGLEGVELYYDSYLKGKSGWKNSYRDAKRNLIFSDEEYMPESKGYNLILTVDEVIQHFIESEIKEILKAWRPKGAMIIAMNPATGEILGMASYPDYNPNCYQRFNKEYFKNKCVTDTLEPGSVFKSFTASAILQEKAVSLDDKIFCENGEYKVSKRILHDYHPYGTLTFREVIEKSSNIGTVKAASRLGKDRFYNYIVKFGFGAKTGIDLAGEENGIVRAKSTWTDSDMTTIPMGQGISVTVIQLARAMSCVVNGGVLAKPRVVKCITDEDGNPIKLFKPEYGRSVISPEVSIKMRKLLQGVVDVGTGKKAKLDGYTAGGKTGTAQKVGEGGAYTSDKYVGSFVGYAPATIPKVVLAVCVDEPRGNHFGGVVAAPAFANIMNKTLKYLEVPEDAKKTK